VLQDKPRFLPSLYLFGIVFDRITRASHIIPVSESLTFTSV